MINTILVFIINDNHFCQALEKPWFLYFMLNSTLLHCSKSVAGQSELSRAGWNRGRTGREEPVRSILQADV